MKLLTIILALLAVIVTADPAPANGLANVAVHTHPKNNFGLRHRRRMRKRRINRKRRRDAVLNRLRK